MSNSAERAQLEQVGRALLAAEASRDLETTVGHFAPDAAIHVEGQPLVQGRDAIRAFYRTFFEQVPFSDLRLSPRTLAVASSGDLAYESGDNLLIFDTPAGPQQQTSRYLAVWRRIADDWRLAELAITSDQPGDSQ